MSWYESALQNAKGEARRSSPYSSRSRSRLAHPDRPLHVRELVGVLLWRSWFLLLGTGVWGQKKQGALREEGVAAAPYKLGLIQPSFLAVYQTLAFFPILILTRILTLTAWSSLEAKTWWTLMSSILRPHSSPPLLIFPVPLVPAEGPSGSSEDETLFQLDQKRWNTSYPSPAYPMGTKLHVTSHIYYF